MPPKKGSRPLFKDSPNYCWVDVSIKQDIDIDISKLTGGSGKEIICRCPGCKHIVRTNPHLLGESLTTICKYCTNQQRCDDITCIACFERSLASKVFSSFETFLYYARLRSKKQTLGVLIRILMLFNKSRPIPIRVDLRKISIDTNKNKSEYLCQTCWHIFDSTPSRSGRLVDNSCPYCSKVPKTMCSDMNCSSCLKKSFASHERAKCWDARPGKNMGQSKRDGSSNEVIQLTPLDVFKAGQHKADLICDECDHEFQSICCNINTGFWCPFCTGHKRCDDPECDMCTNRKLSSCPGVEFWDYEMNERDYPGESPDNICSSTSLKRYWFKCQLGIHPSHQKAPSKIRRNQMCPLCVRKTQSIVGEFMKISEIKCQPEQSPIWLRNGIKNSFPRFDFLLEEKMFLELDGPQHFRQIREWKDPITQMNLDVQKMKKSVENSYSGFRLYQPDVFENKVDWKSWTRRAIELINQQSNPVWVFPKSSENIYEEHINQCKLSGILVHILE
jgi:DNA-directed RNA polymerase subunit RPC12/RpoP